MRLRAVSISDNLPDGSCRPAVASIGLAVAPDEFAALFGPTGCSKSTSLGVVAGLVRFGEELARARIDLAWTFDPPSVERSGKG